MCVMRRKYIPLVSSGFLLGFFGYWLLGIIVVYRERQKHSRCSFAFAAFVLACYARGGGKGKVGWVGLVLRYGMSLRIRGIVLLYRF